MSRSSAPLFRPLTINGLTLSNRIVMAPMPRSKSPGGIPGPEVAAYYRRRAENETGLIVTEGTTINDPVSSMDVDVPNFFGEALKGWKHVVEEVHGVGRALLVDPAWARKIHESRFDALMPFKPEALATLS